MKYNRRTARRHGRLRLPKIPKTRGKTARNTRVKLIVVGVFSVLVLVNLWVFVWGRKSFVKVRKRAVVGSVKHAGAAARFRKRGKSPVDLDVPAALVGGAQHGTSHVDGDLSDMDSRVLSGKIRRGDNLYTAFKRLGLTRHLTDRIVGTLAPLYNFRRARPGQTFTVRVSGDGKHVFEFEFRAAPAVVYLVRRVGDRLVAERSAKPIERRIVLVGVPVTGPLYASVRKSGEKPTVAGLIIRALSWDLNFYTDLHKGDIIKLVLEKEYLDGSFYRYGRLLAARYEGKTKRSTAVWYQTASGRTGYFDQRGRSLRRNIIKTPLRYTKITSKFNRHRFHPILHRYRAHLGVDFAAPSGTPVWAAADGEVAFAARNRAAGNMVVVEHESNITTVYMHLLRFARGIKKGVTVRQRQVIGYVGSTGRSTGPHLHFGIKVNGEYVDPLKFKAIRAPGIPAREMGAFRRMTVPLVERLASMTVTHPVVMPAGDVIEAALGRLDRRIGRAKAKRKQRMEAERKKREARAGHSRTNARRTRGRLRGRTRGRTRGRRSARTRGRTHLRMRPRSHR
ncbi:MAG: peptidoglycan DD-metalloendopeptidase family protein [Deltaproteobacteria bacterium]|nr:peptidoglycan DD-metalloendopeptidase family protein [Deltaproteobacteria bacterium]